METAKVAKAIAYLRKRAGYTQKDLAERLGVSDKAVSKWERGLGLPDISCLRKLSILLDTDTDSLLAGDVIHHDSGWHGVLLLDGSCSEVKLNTIIYDKPLAYILLSYFLLVGIKKIFVVSSAEDIEYMKTRFGDGRELGITLLYSDNEVFAAETAFGECSNCMIVHGRSFIYGVDQTRFFQKAMLDKAHLTVLSLPKGRRTAQQQLCFDDNKKVICTEDGEELNTQYAYYDIPFVFCPQYLFAAVCDAIANGGMTDNIALKDQYLYTEVLDRGFVEMRVDTIDDVAAVSAFIKIVQQACGMNIYCLEEIAWRRGMISFDQLRRFGERQKDTEYGQYILNICNI